MKKFTLIFLIGIICAQEKAPVFIEAPEKASVYDDYPTWIYSFNTGYLFNESNHLIHSHYENNFNINTTLEHYFFGGSYIYFNVAVSEMFIRFDRIVSQGLEIRSESRNKYIVISPYVGLKYYLGETNSEFTNNWYVASGIGLNYFHKNSNDKFRFNDEAFKRTNESYSRLSMMFTAGKLLPIQFLGGKFTVQANYFLHEDKGLLFDKWYRGYRFDYVLYNTIELGLGLTFN